MRSWIVSPFGKATPFGAPESQAPICTVGRMSECGMTSFTSGTPSLSSSASQTSPWLSLS